MKRRPKAKRATVRRPDKKRVFSDADQLGDEVAERLIEALADDEANSVAREYRTIRRMIASTKLDHMIAAAWAETVSMSRAEKEEWARTAVEFADALLAELGQFQDFAGTVTGRVS